jgi:hypothetical protein
MIIDKHREYLHTFQKGNEQAINIMSSVALKLLIPFFGMNRTLSYALK